MSLNAKRQQRRIVRSDLDCAESFERACVLVHDEKESNTAEPVILLAFYAALRYVNYFLFPLEVTDRQGRTSEAATLDEYIQRSGERGPKHEVRLRLLEAKDANVADAYHRLWDSADKARYGLESFPQALADQSVRLMDEVKDCCIKKEQEDEQSEIPEVVKVPAARQGE